MSLSDQELLSAIAGGEGPALAAFYDRHAARVRALLLRWLGRPEDAEDVLQETFWQVWRRADRYDHRRSPPGAWLVLLARSRALDYLRQRRPEGAAVTDSDGSQRDDPLSPLEQDDEARLLREALAQLPDEQRSAITLAFYDGLTNQEVARHQAIPLGTAKTRIRLAMKRLRELLDG